MLSFKQHIQLNEKLLLINNGKKYGQIVFLAGGAGSGKGFAGENFMNISDFKVRDVDEQKKLFLTLNKKKGLYPELAGLDLKKPDDVFTLHKFVEDKLKTDKDGIDKTLANILKGMAVGNKETLPNIVFDVTLKNIKKIKEIAPELLGLGYKTENIHLVWVLTDYDIAVKANKDRDRVVPDDILLQTHQGARNTMWGIVGRGNIPKEINGGIYVILNNRDQTITFKETDGKDYRSSDDDGKSVARKTTGKVDKDGNPITIIKSFTYLTYKKPGKPPMKDLEIKKELFRWVSNNTPFIKSGEVNFKVHKV